MAAAPASSRACAGSPRSSRPWRGSARVRRPDVRAVRRPVPSSRARGWACGTGGPGGEEVGLRGTGKGRPGGGRRLWGHAPERRAGLVLTVSVLGQPCPGFGQPSVSGPLTRSRLIRPAGHRSCVYAACSQRGRVPVRNVGGDLRPQLGNGPDRRGFPSGLRALRCGETSAGRRRLVTKEPSHAPGIPESPSRASRPRPSPSLPRLWRQPRLLLRSDAKEQGPRHRVRRRRQGRPVLQRRRVRGPGEGQEGVRLQDAPTSSPPTARRTPTRCSAWTQLAKQGYNPVIGVGFAYAPGREGGRREVPEDHLRHRRRLAPSRRKNVANLVFNEEQASYLAGVAAAKATKSNTVGFVGGVDVPLINKFEAGYEQGVKDTKPGVKVLSQYLTQTAARGWLLQPRQGQDRRRGPDREERRRHLRRRRSVRLRVSSRPPPRASLGHRCRLRPVQAGRPGEVQGLDPDLGHQGRRRRGLQPGQVGRGRQAETGVVRDGLKTGGVGLADSNPAYKKNDRRSRPRSRRPRRRSSAARSRSRPLTAVPGSSRSGPGTRDTVTSRPARRPFWPRSRVR